MAKQAKMKKGSIGKKALAAILAASMVLSSSAFSVLAATQPVTEPGQEPSPIAAGDDLMTIAANDMTWTGAKFEWTNSDGTAISGSSKVFDGKEVSLSKITLQRTSGGDGTVITPTNGQWPSYIQVSYSGNRRNVGSVEVTITVTAADDAASVPAGTATATFTINPVADQPTISSNTVTNYNDCYRGSIAASDFVVLNDGVDLTDCYNIEVKDDLSEDTFTVTATLKDGEKTNFTDTNPASLNGKYHKLLAYFKDGEGLSVTTDERYTGSAVTPEVVVYDCNEDHSITQHGEGDCVAIGEGAYKLTWHNNTDAWRSGDPTTYPSNVRPSVDVTFGDAAYPNANYLRYGDTLYFQIGAIDIGGSTVTKESVAEGIELGFNYNGHEQYPGKNTVTIVTAEGTKIVLEENKHYKVVPGVGTDNLKDACCTNRGSTNAGDIKSFAIKGIGGYTGTITHAIQESTGKTTPLQYHIWKVPMSLNNNVRVETVELVSTVGGQQGKSAIKDVYDILPDKEEALGSDEYKVWYYHEEETNANLKWKDYPANTPGTHRAKIQATANATNFTGEIEVEYTVIEKNSLQMYVDNAKDLPFQYNYVDWTTRETGRATYERAKNLGKATYTTVTDVAHYYEGEHGYDGFNKFPVNYEAILDEIQVLDGDVTTKTTLKEGTDYRIVTPASDWTDAGTYEIKLEGMGRLTGQEAVITMVVYPKHLNNLVLNTKSSIVNSGDGVEIWAQQGTHTNSRQKSEVIVTIRDAVGAEKPAPRHITHPFLERGKDYDYEVQGGYVVITGKGNYTTDLTTPTDSTLPKVHTQKIDVQDFKMLMGDSSIEGRVTEEYRIDVIGDVVKVDPHDVEIIEKDTPKDYTLRHGVEESKHDFLIIGYLQDGKFYSVEDGVPYTGPTQLLVEGTGNFFGIKAIDFTIHGTVFADTVNVTMKHSAYALNANTETVSAKSVFDDVEVIYNSNKAEMPIENYELYIVDADGEVVAKRTIDDYGVERITPPSAVIKKTGTYTLRVVPYADRDNRYEGVKEITFSVNGINIASVAAVAAIPDATYIGSQITPEPVVTRGTTTLTKGVDYEVEYGDNIKAEVAKVVVKGINKYSGEIVKTFQILSNENQKITLDAAQVKGLQSRTTGNKNCTMRLSLDIPDAANVYTFKSSDTKVATVTSKNGTGIIRYQGVGTATITVTATSSVGNTTGAELNVEVVVKKPGKPTFTPSNKLSKAAKTFTVTSSTVRGADGWIVQYSENSNMSKASKKVVTGVPKKLSRNVVTVKKSGARYYVRVRAFQTVDGKRIMGAWSPVKSVKSR